MNLKMEVSIRHARIEDAEPISLLSDQLGYKSNNNRTLNRLVEILKNKDNCVFVAVDNDKIIGWIHGFYTLRVESDPFVEIGGLVVDKNYRKNGIGKLLVEYIINWCTSKKYRLIRVRCNTIRIESHKFYKNIGFIEKKQQKIFDKQLE
ncbi:ribosomal-protein-alanine N-acetyltransferase [Aquimarina sp. MAR_2010_214]|uniref:GNAT family N-acetyltransferase n=1 Tax=Aquimarina sp. MAR_2010_214 TaxID=1250026 RepID=UPI000CC453E3|nr:GNAT family N-acetyltransferase [Aquimarina sp. MAR_2010_214]PKV51647.1 ribosomal-protein-alanine N-acetyltransferase [Aquimarina sp. MAR_2010_214]